MPEPESRGISLGGGASGAALVVPPCGRPAGACAERLMLPGVKKKDGTRAAWHRNGRIVLLSDVVCWQACRPKTHIILYYYTI